MPCVRLWAVACVPCASPFRRSEVLENLNLCYLDCMNHEWNVGDRGIIYMCLI